MHPEGLAERSEASSTSEHKTQVRVRIDVGGRDERGLMCSGKE